MFFTCNLKVSCLLFVSCICLFTHWQPWLNTTTKKKHCHLVLWVVAEGELGLHSHTIQALSHPLLKLIINILPLGPSLSYLPPIPCLKGAGADEEKGQSSAQSLLRAVWNIVSSLRSWKPHNLWWCLCSLRIVSLRRPVYDIPRPGSFTRPRVLL